jgi:hypothetical protein
MDKQICNLSKIVRHGEDKSQLARSKNVLHVLSINISALLQLSFLDFKINSKCSSFISVANSVFTKNLNGFAALPLLTKAAGAQTNRSSLDTPFQCK